MDERIKKTGKFAIAKGKFLLMLVGLLILVLLIKKVGLAQLMSIVNEMNPIYVLIAAVPWIFTMFAGAYRLKKLVSADINFFEIFKIYCYGFLLNYASPIQGFGAGAKIAMLKMKKVKVSKSSASVGSEIGYDILFSLAVVMIFFVYHVDFLINQLKEVLNLNLIYIGLIILLMLIVAAGILRKHKFVVEFFEHLIGSFKLNKMKKLLPVTLLMWVLPATVIYLLFIAAGSPISYWIALGSICIGFIFGLASFIPGGLGVRDAITAYVYSLSGVPLDMTISIAIFNRFFTIGIVLLVVIFLKAYEK
ncbi:YbhN family protein [candidate division KSB1 bacterium]